MITQCKAKQLPNYGGDTKIQIQVHLSELDQILHSYSLELILIKNLQIETDNRMDR